MYNKLITISAFDRVEYFNKVLDYLSRCYHIQDYTIYCFIDPSNRSHEITRILDTYSTDLLNVGGSLINEQRLDCNGNIFRCLDFGFQYADYVIHIEDDIIFAKDALLYFEHCNKIYKDDKSIFSVCSYNRYNRRDYKPRGLNTVYKQKHFDPWGWATWKDRWEEQIRPNWQFGYGPRYNKEGIMVHKGGGWDVNMQSIIREDQRRINPNCSRSKNIGRYGRHTPSVDYHIKTHEIQWWSDDFDIGSDIMFTEGECEVEHD